MLDLPSINGALVAMDSTDDVSLPGSLTVASAIAQSNTASTNTFNGAVVINNNLVVSAAAKTAAKFSSTDKEGLLSFSVNGSRFDLYGLENTPSVTAARGSLAIDRVKGKLYINTDGTVSGWNAVAVSSGGIVPGGNKLNTTLVIGSKDAQALSLITS
ncbi:hypothetical protein ElyMa_000742300, partial [Elysia marginata]